MKRRYWLSPLALTLALSACSVQRTSVGAPQPPGPPAHPSITDPSPTEPIEVLRLADLPITVVDIDAQVLLGAAETVAPKSAQPRAADSDVRALREDDAVVLRWKNAWLAGLRVEAPQPLNLKRFVDAGVLEFDVRAGDLSKSGFSVAIDCGPDCWRRVNHVLASRELAGRGWQRLSFSAACFMRDGADFTAVKRPFIIETSGTGEVAVRNVRWLVRGTPNTHCPDWRTQSVTPQPLQEVWSTSWWIPRHEQKLAAIAKAPPSLVFIGDSITQSWEKEGQAAWARLVGKQAALNLGFRGDRTENVLWRLRNGELDGYRAKAIVLMIGTNNAGDRQENPATIAAGIRLLLDEIQTRQPQAQVLLLALFPRDRQPGTRLRRLNERVNQIIQGHADGRRVHWLDVGAQFTQADGSLSPEIFPDALHLSPAGYERWAAALQPTLSRLLAP